MIWNSTEQDGVVWKNVEFVTGGNNIRNDVINIEN